MSREAVKSAADFPAAVRSPVGTCGRFARWRRAYAALALLVLSPCRSVQATERDSGPSLLFGGAVQPRKPPIRLDPVLPRGERRDVLPELGTLKLLCSSVRPVCVDRSFGSKGLAALVAAYEEYTYGASLPAPHAGFERPLIFARGEGQLQVNFELEQSRGFDRGRARCHAARISPSLSRRCVSEAALGSLAPAGASWLRSGQAAQWSSEMGAAPEVSEAVRRAAFEPQVGILTSTRRYRDPRNGRAVSISGLRSARFFSYLDKRSDAPLGHAGFLSLILGATKTEPGAVRFEAEPDLMDVLSATLGGNASDLARLFDDFARFSFFEPIAPYQLSSNDSTLRNEMVDWRIDGASLPRSLILSRAIEPTGSAYVILALTSAQRRKTVAMQTHCESPVSYVWSVVRLDGQGEAMSTLHVGYKERGTSVEARVSPQEGTTRLVFVGTNMGGVDMAHPFDPDHEPHEAHGCRLYLSVLPDGETSSGSEELSDVESSTRK